MTDLALRPVQPVVLSGGSGTRLWPLSRKTYPKQFLALTGDQSLLAQTVGRTRRCVPDGWTVKPPTIVANEAQRSLVKSALQAAGHDDARLVLEPVARNTAPAIALAARLSLMDGDDALLLVLPSDHVIGREDRFRQALAQAAAAADQGRLVTFGIEPDRPETGYGYIRAGAPLAEATGAFAIDRFVEKPSAERAADLLAEGGWSWNSGMFLFGARELWAEVERLAPEMADAIGAAVDAGVREGDDFLPEPVAFAAAPSLPIDVAVMERTGLGAVIPAALGWNDVGSWRALLEMAPKDEAGSALVGDVQALETAGCYLRSEDTALVAIGVSDLAIVATPDAVLVCSLNKINLVKTAAESMSQQGKAEADDPYSVSAAWGTVRTLDREADGSVRKVSVDPGATADRPGPVDRLLVLGGSGTLVVDGSERDSRDGTAIPVDRGYLARADDSGLELLEVRRR